MGPIVSGGIDMGRDRWIFAGILPPRETASREYSPAVLRKTLCRGDKTCTLPKNATTIRYAMTRRGRLGASHGRDDPAVLSISSMRPIPSILPGYAVCAEWGQVDFAIFGGRPQRPSPVCYEQTRLAYFYVTLAPVICRRWHAV